jgi:hypothetical protein
MRLGVAFGRMSERERTGEKGRGRKAKFGVKSQGHVQSKSSPAQGKAQAQALEVLLSWSLSWLCPSG